MMAACPITVRMTRREEQLSLLLGVLRLVLGRPDAFLNIESACSAPGLDVYLAVRRGWLARLNPPTVIRGQKWMKTNAPSSHTITAATASGTISSMPRANRRATTQAKISRITAVTG